MRFLSPRAANLVFLTQCSTESDTQTLDIYLVSGHTRKATAKGFQRDEQLLDPVFEHLTSDISQVLSTSEKMSLKVFFILASKFKYPNSLIM